MPGITQFEVQVQQGQRWSIHAQFGSFQKEAAVEEAAVEASAADEAPADDAETKPAE